jgi:N-acetylmuramoyl-L-alanine amidase
VRGVETYYLNFSKNDKAAAVAARENGTSLKQVGDLEMILFDLMANSKINESSRLAAEIQSSLVGNLGRHYSEIKDHGVRQGPFYVLLGATMPSVLVETAFISNKAEEDRLKNSKFQGRAADAIVAGVKKFAKDSRMIATK